MAQFKNLIVTGPSSFVGDVHCLGNNKAFKVGNASYSIGLHMGNGGVNRGIYDFTNSKWIVYADANSVQLNGNATTATKATQDGSGNTITSYYCTLSTTQTLSGAKTFSNATTTIQNKLQLTRATGVGHGRISFYNPSYYTWFEYMSNPVASGCPTGGTPSSYGGVTGWARRSLIENSAGYGWIWEGASNAAASGATAPTPLMALNSNTGNLTVKGYVSTETGFANSNGNVHVKAGTGSYSTILNNTVGHVDDGAANIASGTWSLATGTGTQATGWASFSGGSGYKTVASGNSSFAFGTGYNFTNTTASARGAVTFGGNSSGEYSFSVSGTAAHNHAFAMGQGTKTFYANSFVVGKYNADNGAIFAIGCGTSDSARDNAFEVDADGNAISKGMMYAYGLLGSDAGEVYLNNSSIAYNATDECFEFNFY